MKNVIPEKQGLYENGDLLVKPYPTEGLFEGGVFDWGLMVQNNLIILTKFLDFLCPKVAYLPDVQITIFINYCQLSIRCRTILVQADFNYVILKETKYQNENKQD